MSEIDLNEKLSSYNNNNMFFENSKLFKYVILSAVFAGSYFYLLYILHNLQYLCFMLIYMSRGVYYGIF
jgi:hypothetical protein